MGRVVPARSGTQGDGLSLQVQGGKPGRQQRQRWLLREIWALAPCWGPLGMLHPRLSGGVHWSPTVPAMPPPAWRGATRRARGQAGFAVLPWPAFLLFLFVSLKTQLPYSLPSNWTSTLSRVRL